MSFGCYGLGVFNTRFHMQITRVTTQGLFGDFSMEVFFNGARKIARFPGNQKSVSTILDTRCGTWKPAYKKQLWSRVQTQNISSCLTPNTTSLPYEIVREHHHHKYSNKATIVETKAPNSWFVCFFSNGNPAGDIQKYPGFISTQACKYPSS